MAMERSYNAMLKNATAMQRCYNVTLKNATAIMRCYDEAQKRDGDGTRFLSFAS